MNGTVPDSRSQNWVSSDEENLVTVVVAVLDAHFCASETISSIQAQTWRNLECVIVNDTGTDPSRWSLAGQINQGLRLRVISHATISGLNAARNTGLRTAHGELVCFLDSTRVLLPGYIEAGINLLRDYSDPSVAGVSWEHISDRHSQTGHPKLSSVPEPTVMSIHSVTQSRHPVMARARQLRAVGGFDESRSLTNHNDLLTRTPVTASRTAKDFTIADSGPSSSGKTEFLQSPSADPTAYDIIFLPHKDYHVWTISLCLEALSELGFNPAIVDLSAHHRDEGIRKKAKELDLPLISYGNFCLGSFEPSLLVAFNDWEPRARAILMAAEDVGIATACIVEGIQDYNDSDTGRQRHAYRSVQHVLLPGTFDERYFKDSSQSVYTAGIPRIEALRRAVIPPPQANTPRVALINTNFSYGVLEDHRDTWLKQAVHACKECGLRPVITRHPADKGELYPELVTNDTFYEAVICSDIVIQRFASGILEALAMRRPVIYFNPHDEQVDKFKQPIGAYIIANSKDELIEALGEQATFRFEQEPADAFLNLHAGDIRTCSANRTAKAIAEIVKKTQSGREPDFKRFGDNLRILDIASDSLSRPKVLASTF